MLGNKLYDVFLNVTSLAMISRTRLINFDHWSVIWRGKCASQIGDVQIVKAEVLRSGIFSHSNIGRSLRNNPAILHGRVRLHNARRRLLRHVQVNLKGKLGSCCGGG